MKGRVSRTACLSTHPFVCFVSPGAMILMYQVPDTFVFAQGKRSCALNSRRPMTLPLCYCCYRVIALDLLLRSYPATVDPPVLPFYSCRTTTPTAMLLLNKKCCRPTGCCGRPTAVLIDLRMCCSGRTAVLLATYCCALS